MEGRRAAWGCKRPEECGSRRGWGVCCLVLQVVCPSCRLPDGDGAAGGEGWERWIVAGVMVLSSRCWQTERIVAGCLSCAGGSGGLWVCGVRDIEPSGRCSPAPVYLQLTSGGHAQGKQVMHRVNRSVALSSGLHQQQIDYACCVSSCGSCMHAQVVLRHWMRWRVITDARGRTASVPACSSSRALTSSIPRLEASGKGSPCLQHVTSHMFVR